MSRDAELAGNEILWLAEGQGAHGSEPRAVDEVTASLRGCFAFVEESADEPGLRSPQLGALHAILAHRSMETEEPITIVMPTGTGKTEAMLAAFAHTPARTPCSSPEQPIAQPDCLEVCDSRSPSCVKGATGRVPVSRLWASLSRESRRPSSVMSCSTLQRAGGNRCCGYSKFRRSARSAG